MSAVVSVLGLRSCEERVFSGRRSRFGSIQTKLVARGIAGLTSAGIVPRNDLAVHRHRQHRESCRLVEKRVLAGSPVVAILSDVAIPAKEGLGLLQQLGSLNGGDDRVVLRDDGVAKQVGH